MASAIDPRSAGWNLRLAPARLLRSGDVVTRLGDDHEVERVIRGEQIRVRFTDGTSATYQPTDTPMRWRTPR